MPNASDLSTPERIAIEAEHGLKIIAKWATLLLPIAFAAGSKPSDVVCSIIAITFLAHCITTRNFSWVQQDWLKILALLWVYTLVRGAFAETPIQGILEALAWSRFLLLAAALGTWILIDAAWRHKFMLSVTAVSAFLASDAIFQYIVGVDVFGIPYVSGDAELGVRLTASIGKVYVGAALSWMFLPAALGLYALNYRIASAAFAGLCLLAILLTGERMATLAALAAFAFALPLLRLSRRTLTTIALVTIVGVVSLLALRPNLYERQVRSMLAMAQNVGGNAYGIIWKRSLHIASEHPIFGIGMGQFRTECRKPMYGPYDASDRNKSFYCDAHPHHIYLEWMVEGGLVAVSLFALGVGALFRRLLQHMLASPRNLVLIGASLTLAIRLFPFSTSPGLMRAWAAIPLWMLMGWAFSYVYASEPKSAAKPSTTTPT